MTLVSPIFITKTLYLTLYLWESNSTFYLPGGGALLPSLLFSSYLRLKQSNFEDKGIHRTRMDLPSFLNERMQICMHAWAHACTLIVAGDKKMWFFWLKGQSITICYPKRHFLCTHTPMHAYKFALFCLEIKAGPFWFCIYPNLKLDGFSQRYDKKVGTLNSPPS